MAASLETERLRLRRIEPSDLDLLVALDADPEVVRYLTGGAPTPRALLRNEILPRLLRSDPRFPHGGFWAVTSPVTGAFLGWVGLEAQVTEGRLEAELGYRLRREVWRRGYATEAARALLDRFFREVDGHRVHATTYEHNLASRRVAEKLGMSVVRRFRMTPEQLERPATHAAGAGEPWDGDELEYAVVRAAWLLRRASPSP